MSITPSSPAVSTASTTTNNTKSNKRIGGVIFVSLVVFITFIIIIGLIKNSSYNSSIIPIIGNNANKTSSTSLTSTSSSIFRSRRRRRRLQQQHHELQELVNEQKEEQVNEIKDESVSYNDYIPNQFLYDKDYNILPFPRWEYDLNNKQDFQKSIMDSIIDFINKQTEFLFQYGNYSLKDTNMIQYKDNLSKMAYSINMPHTSDHIGDIYDTPEGWEPEQLYIVDGKKRIIMTSQYTKDISDTNGYSIGVKYNPTERIMHAGFNILLNNEKNIDMEQIIPIRWPKLYQLLIIENGSFPFIAHYSDYIGCNYHNWNNNTESIPLFTVAGTVQCNYTFPFPNSGLSWGSRYFPYEWYNQFQNNIKKYGEYKNRISKVIWRGNLSGKMPKDIQKRGPRWHLNYYINHNLTMDQSNLFDIHLTSLDNLANNEWIDPNELGGYDSKYQISPQDDYQKYKAILDIDGHSWSGRFASLLCYSSVILKIEPDYVDYFYSPTTTTTTTVGINDDDNNNVKGNINEQHHHQYAVIPWKHYIPIKRDLTDLIEKVQYVMNPINEEHILHIINNANEWCAQRFVLRSLGEDSLDIFEKYITILDKSSELKNLFQSHNHNNNNQNHNSENDERLLSSSSSYEEHVDWRSQWNGMKDSIYNSVLQMEPANPSW